MPLTPAQSFKRLSVVLDTQVMRTAKLAFSYVYPDLATANHAMFISRVDDCNSLYTVLPWDWPRSTICSQMWWHKSCQECHKWHIYSQCWTSCTGFRWSIVRVKVLVVTFKTLSGWGPVYLLDSLYSRRVLFSAESSLLVIPGSKDIQLSSTRARALLIYIFYLQSALSCKWVLGGSQCN